VFGLADWTPNGTLAEYAAVEACRAGDAMPACQLPTSPVTRAVLTTVQDLEHPALINHSLRSYWHARRIAEAEGVLAELSDDLLFAATVLHEMGVFDNAPGRERFEVEGADIAAETLLACGVDEADVHQVWDAIALHTSADLAERRGLLPRVVRTGILADFRRATGPACELQDDLHAAWPRIELETTVVDYVVARGSSASALPRYGFGGVLLHERTAHGTTDVEAAAQALGW
jgi:HD domain